MFTFLSTDGESQIANIKGSSKKLVLESFSVGYIDRALLPDIFKTNLSLTDFPSLKDPTFITTNFNEYAVRTHTNISYVNINNTRLIIKCYLEPNNIKFHFNSVLLYASIDNVKKLFMINYSMKTNPNFSMQITKTGTKYYHMIVIDVPDINGWFDLSNLTIETPDFDEFDDLYEVPEAQFMERDQLILRTHPMQVTTTQHFVINSSEQWYSTPMFKYQDDGQYNLFDNYYKELPDSGLPDGYEMVTDNNGDPLISINNIPFIRAT